MKMIDLINKALDAYEKGAPGDRALLYDQETGKPCPREVREKYGDGLAEFIVVELWEAVEHGEDGSDGGPFDDDGEDGPFHYDLQIMGASAAIGVALEQIQRVSDAI